MSKHKKQKKKDPVFFWKITSGVLLIAFIISTYFALIPKEQKTVEAKISQACTDSDVQKAIEFINQNFVRPGTKASLINYSEENVCWILTEYKGNHIPVILKQRNVLVLPYNVIDIEETKRKLEEQKKKMEKNIPKTEKPEVKLFIMSFCPYGRQAAEAMINVYRLLKDKADIKVHYVIYPSDYYKGREEQYCIDSYCAMHGLKELKENLREICIAKLYGWDAYWSYMEKQLKSCDYNNIETCWKTVAQEVGIDIAKIEECVKVNATAYLKEEYELNKKYGVTASPTLFINNVTYRGQRTPEAFKQAICIGFINPPKECSQKLSQTSSVSTGKCG
ncbi:MAG TPA: hypothetical protein EYH56_03225 [Nanoarchaeota archaeon]|nr:hypothetical protein [Nanoarchaeota archaeon]